MKRRRYEGPVFFDDRKGSHFTLGWRKRRLTVLEDGSFALAHRSDPSHQSRFHRRFAEVTPS